MSNSSPYTRVVQVAKKAVSYAGEVGVNLRSICNEVFGEQNFIATVIWRKNYAPKSTAKHFSEDHDYILVFGKNADMWTPHKMPRTEKQNKAYKNPDNDPRGLWRPNNLAARNYYSKGTYSITCPSGRVINGPPSGSYWRVSEEKFHELDKDGRIWWGKMEITFLLPKSFSQKFLMVSFRRPYGHMKKLAILRMTKKEIKSIFSGEMPFDTPKPYRLIERILQIASDSDSIILDSFAGSGTTAHAVLNMNKADGGHRKFILVEMMDYADSITAERVKRVIKGYGEGKNAVEGTGGNFSFYDLGEPLLVGDCLNEAVAPKKIREYIWFMETKQPYAPPSGGNPYYLGRHNSTGYYFYYEPQRVTVLDYAFLSTITEKADGTVIYADRCSISEDKLAKMSVTFKKIPRDISRL